MYVGKDLDYGGGRRHEAVKHHRRYGRGYIENCGGNLYHVQLGTINKDDDDDDDDDDDEDKDDDDEDEDDDDDEE